MPLKLPQRRIWRITIYLISTLLILLAIDLVMVRTARRITPGAQTTRITEPRFPDGRIDYLAALENWYAQDVTPEDNAVPLILQALGPKGLPRNQPREGITNRLGMAPLPDQGDYFLERSEGFLEDPKVSDSDGVNALPPVLEHPWKAADHPRTAAWLEANAKPLALIAEATKRPRYFLPLNGGTPTELMFDIQLPHLHRLRDAGRALACRALLKAGNGDFAGARQDLLTAHELARLMGEKTTTLIDRLVAYMIDSTACAAEAAIARESKLDATEAKAWVKAMQGLAPLSEFDSVIDVPERYLFLQLMQYASEHGVNAALRRVDASMIEATRLSGAPPKPLASTLTLEFVPIRVSRVMEEGNAWYDRFVAALQKPNGPERREAIRKVEAEFQAFAEQGEPWRRMSAWGWPNFLKITDRRDTAIARRAIALAAMQLAAYHAQHGSYLPSLDAQTSLDPFTNQSLKYRPSGETYLLYSVGPNLADDAGSGDDLSIGK